MKTLKNPDLKEWAKLAQRPSKSIAELDEIVDEVFDNIRQKGDKALFEYSLKFDKAKLKSLKIEQDELKTSS